MIKTVEAPVNRDQSQTVKLCQRMKIGSLQVKVGPVVRLSQQTHTRCDCHYKHCTDLGMCYVLTVL